MALVTEHQIELPLAQTCWMMLVRMPAVTKSYNRRSNAMTQPWKRWRLAVSWLNAQAVAATLDMQHPSTCWADLPSTEDARQQMLA